MIKQLSKLPLRITVHFLLLSFIQFGLILLLLVKFFTGTQPAVASEPGDLDTTFGNNGTITTTIGSRATVGDMIIQPDGKIVVAGYSDDSFALVRYNSDGSVDGNFDSDGIITTTIGSSASGNDVIIQPDGKLVVAGSSDGNFALARYNSDGSVDGNFDSDGIITTTIGSSASGNGMIIQPDSKLVVAGTSDGNFALARYNSDGSLDSQFGSSGIITTHINVSSGGNALVIQPDGKIIVAGGSNHGGDYNAATITLARYNSNGSLDSDFGSNGIVDTYIEYYGGGGPGYAGATTIAIQPDGKIIAAGWCFVGFEPAIALVRYNSDGSLDHGFGTNGILASIYGAAEDLIVQPNGKIIVAGNYVDYNWVPPIADFALLRYRSNGDRDSGFGNNGLVTTNFDEYETGHAVSLQADGKIVVAGSIYQIATTYYPTTLALARYINDDPTIDDPIIETATIYVPMLLKN